MPAEHAYVPDMPQLMTAEELLHTNAPNKRTELVRGRFIVHEPPGGRHGYVAANLAFRLKQHSDLTGAGAVFVGDVGFTLHRDPDTVRGPDVAFVRTDRLPQPIPNTYLEFAPDLVVEVLSHNERPGEVLAKVWRLARCGCAPGVGDRSGTPCRASAARWHRFSVRTLLIISVTR